MKLGWIIVSGPAALVEPAMARLEVIGDTYLSASTPGQLALADMLAVRGDLQNQMRQRFRSNLVFLDALFPRGGSVERLKREGGCYSVLRFSPTTSDDSLPSHLLQPS